MRKLLLACVFVLAFLGSAGQALAATKVVDKDGMATPSNCNAAAPASTTIQGAVNSANPGDTIRVCPAIYPEQVTIPDNKDRITLVSTQRRAAIIQAPPVFNPTEPDIVQIDGARDVSLLRFTVRGPIPDVAFCNPLLVSGVRIIGGGSANLVDNRITEIRGSLPLFGCQNGFGVSIGRTAESETGTGRLFANEIDRYQKGGIYVDNEGSFLDARGNTVSGDGGLTTIAQNGVQVSRNADARVEDNLVEDNTYIGVEQGLASGFILFDLTSNGARVEVEDNLVRRNDTNIALYNADRGSYEDNRALNATFYDGLYADTDSERNRFEENSAFGNREHDCHDDSLGDGTEGTANFWDDNEGRIDTPPGICTDDDDDDDDDDDEDDEDDDD